MRSASGQAGRRLRQVIGLIVARYLEISAEIAQRIRSGELAPGTELPTSGIGSVTTPELGRLWRV